MGYTRPDQEEVLLSSVRYLLGLRLGPLAEVMRDEAAAEASALQEQIVALRRMLPGGILLARQVL